MAGLKHFHKHSANSPSQSGHRSVVKCPKSYGVVEVEIEVTELLENISIAMHYLQKLDLFSATNCELRILQKDVAALIGSVATLKHKIQKTFKDITFQEDIRGLMSSEENARGMTSKELIDKTWRNVQESDELDEAQSEAITFHRRFTAGSSIVASEGPNHPRVPVKREERVKPMKMVRNAGKNGSEFTRESIQDSGYNRSGSKGTTNLSSYNFSKNSEVALSCDGKNAKKWNESRELMVKKIKNSKKKKSVLTIF
ncbi:unnamed protein product [Litomosoides sigmodontis]|uniref:Uncharacterized protein n=1 Tax=Litomosoides sigmodontis TaxID=42156 RepID=A0A3P6SYZ5_LITSI|nr:unnamed protein product [Litomosoides sigmodontis]